MPSSHKFSRPLCIALTGGPGGGKSTVGDLFAREHRQGVRLLPEAASLLFSGGFERRTEPAAVRAAQTAIYQVQLQLEAMNAALYPRDLLLCDRGTVDGAAYWPGAPAAFFRHLGTTIEAEFARYDAVIFMQSAAAGGLGIDGGNALRNESILQAQALDRRLMRLWSRHPRFVLVRHQSSFIAKIGAAMQAIEALCAKTSSRPWAATC
jgi:hypothetical protein